MECAAILAFALQDWLDAGLIVAILLLNAAVGWYQEKQAADVVASLKGDIAMKARVVRQGREEDIRARELVPGDIVSRLISIIASVIQGKANLTHTDSLDHCRGRPRRPRRLPAYLRLREPRRLQRLQG